MYILVTLGLLILGALIGAIVTFSMWRHESEDCRTNNTTSPDHNTPHSSPPHSPSVPGSPTTAPQSTPISEPPITSPAPVGLNQTFSSRMHVDNVMTILVRD